jgi:acetylornithine deacetylase/succinyl-diaminopimelate desuccinylase-like protein
VGSAVDILPEVRSICARPAFRRAVIDLLRDLCAIDTSPALDLATLRENERRVFALVRSALERLQLANSAILWQEISPAITSHASFSTPYYASGPVSAVYQGRGNLLLLVDRELADSGNSTALNAHIDTVAPYYPPSCSGDFMMGRGSADDKGNVVVALGVLQVLAELERRQAVSLKNRLTVMFVIDEETGGNGSLDLALDRRLKERYDSLLVLECTDNVLHPANRGAVFIRCAGRAAAGRDQAPASLPEAYVMAILELLDEGEAIRRESNHPLFPHRPVQTCTGILGPFGTHPSAICGEVAFELQGPGLPRPTQLRQLIEVGIQRYVDRYGDKTQVIDPGTGQPKVARHIDLDGNSGDRWSVTIYGATGHMGSLPQNDAAITKWAYVVRELIDHRWAQGGAFTIALPSVSSPAQLVFEGAQGFLPTHAMAEIKARTAGAFQRGISMYLSRAGLPPAALQCEVSFDKLHNDAFAGDPNAASVRRAVQTAREVGLVGADQPLRGWDVSCDARLFAGEYPGLPVITFGAGRLEHAHSNQERVCITDLLHSICFTSLFVLRETGAIP